MITVAGRIKIKETLDYTTQLVPVLSEADAVWADSLLRETSLLPSEN